MPPRLQRTLPAAPGLFAGTRLATEELMYLATILASTQPLAHGNGGGAAKWGVIWGVILIILIACITIPVYYSRKRRREG